jgi:hypothetical protein
MSADYPRVEISSAVELRDWLVANHQVSQGSGWSRTRRLRVTTMCPMRR